MTVLPGVSSDPSWIRAFSQRLDEARGAPLRCRYRSPASPGQSYGRHRGPFPDTARRAAVLVAIEAPASHVLRCDFSAARILLTRRPRTLKHHAGQICLPGGQVEAGESSFDAAVREFEEELGVRPVVTHSLGSLATQYVYASDNRVIPHVVVVRPTREPWNPDPVEVEEVLDIPLPALLDQAAPGRRKLIKRTKTVRCDGGIAGQLEFRAFAFCLGDTKIWGATAMILDELAHHLHHSVASTKKPAN